MIQPQVARLKPTAGKTSPLAPFAGDVGRVQSASRPSVPLNKRGARFAIRDRTAQQHEATEAAFARYDLCKPAHYRAFLTAHAMALPGLELAVTGRGWAGWTPRFPQLVDDLAALGIFLPPPIIATDAEGAAAWGVQYVIEGSRLGGQVLVRKVSPELPTRYLSPPADNGARWRAFCDALDDAAEAGGDVWLDEAVDAAIETFLHFRRAASAMSEDIA